MSEFGIAQVEMEGTQNLKRLKPSVEEKEQEMSGMAIVAVAEKEDTETTGSEEMELYISHILEKIENFTQQVSELLESGRNTFKELNESFEERLITMHREQIEKWQDEIKEVRLLDASNEETNAVLDKARLLVQNLHPRG